MRLERTATGIRLTLGSIVREVGIPSGAHVAITRQGSNWFIWINGSLADSFNSNYPIPRKGATIGPVDTVLDEIRLTLAALYTASFTPPEVPHQAWYQGNRIFTKGQVTQGQVAQEPEPIGGQIVGSKGSITEGSILPNGQVGGSKGSVTEGSVLPNGQVGGSKGRISQGQIAQGTQITEGQIAGTKGFITEGPVLPNSQAAGSKGFIAAGSVFPNGQTGGSKGLITEGSVLPNGQSAGSKGSITEGSVLPNGHVAGSKGQITQGQVAQGPQIIEGQIAETKGFIAEGSVLSNGQTGGTKGQILQGEPAASLVSIPGQNAGEKGFITDGAVIFFGFYPGQSQFAKGFVFQGTTPSPPPLLPPLTGATPSQRQYTKKISTATTRRQQYAKRISSVTVQDQQTTAWTARFLQKEEGQVVPAVSLGGDLAVTPEGQQLRGRLLPRQDPEPGTPLLVTGSPGNYLLDTLSWDPASTSSSSPSAYTPVTLDSQRRCGLCATIENFYTEDFERQRRGILPGWYTASGGSRVYLARRVAGGVQSAKVGPEQGVGRDHALLVSVYSYEECLRRERQVGFWAKGKFAVPFPEPFHAVVLVKIRLDDDENGNWWFSPGWFQSDRVDIPIAPDGSWQATWQGNPRQPPPGGAIQPDPTPSMRTGVFSVFFRFPLEADLATLVELEMCFGNAGIRRIANG